MENIYHLLDKFANEIKAGIYTSFIFLNISADIVHILMILMLFDTGFGIVKSLTMNERFSFKILWFGLISKILILLIPMTLALVGKGLKIYDFTPLVDTVLRVLIVAEGFSIITSMYVIKTKKKVENIDIISMLLIAIRKGLLSVIKMCLKTVEQPLQDDLNEPKKE